jgi:pimeloyl-ACP methyl ester carboxylesterase
MPDIQTNGVSLRCFERGRGEPVVFVHGSASDHRTWRVQHEEFGRSFRTIAYSRRYHWPNDPIPDNADYSMAEHVDDLAGLLSELRATPAHLVGHSYGALVCLLLAAREPHLILRLVLAEPPVLMLFVTIPPRPSEIMKLLLRCPNVAASIFKFAAGGMRPAMAAAKRNDMDRALRAFGGATLGRDAFRRLTDARREQVRANLIKSELFGSGYPPINEDKIRAIRIPTLLISGEKSPPLFHHLMDRLRELLPHADRAEIPAASHIMHEDNPMAYSRAIRSFLGNVR